MKRNRFTVEQIIGMLREAEVRLSYVQRVTSRPHRSQSYCPLAPQAILTTWIVGTTPGDPFPIPGGHGTIPLT